MSLGRVLQPWLPPVIYRLTLRLYLRARGHGWHIFNGCYPTLADVPVRDSHNSEWYVAATSNRATKSILSDEAGLLVLPLTVAQTLSSTRDVVTVLDFGGGAADGLNKIQTYLPNIDLARLRYVLVETPAMCEAMRGKPFVEVTETVPTELPHPLIVHARGSIRYMADYKATLAALAALKPDVFIIAHTPVSDAPTYARQQLNNLHRKIAQWVFNRDQIIAAVEKLGYRLSLAFDHEPPVMYGNAPAPSTDASMVFHKISC